MIEKIIDIAEEAGKIILSFYDSESINFNSKNDNSPITDADIASNNFIVEKLQFNFSYPILSEENIISYNIRKSWSKFWLIDPLDGTKDFIEKNGDFSVSIALIENGKPILGVINVPFHKETYYAKLGFGAYKNGSKIFNKSRRKNLIGTDSNFHSSKETKVFFKNNNIKKIYRYGSCLKLCKVAEGKIDLYPRLNGTKEWDIAAADIILSESGCSLLSYPDRKKLLYNKESLKNSFFIAFKNDIKWK